MQAGGSNELVVSSALCFLLPMKATSLLTIKLPNDFFHDISINIIQISSLLHGQKRWMRKILHKVTKWAIG